MFLPPSFSHIARGKLAPISGSIDAKDSDALAAAARELREETQLITGRDFLPSFCGPPFSFADEHAQRSWTVHSFGWTLTADEDRIQLDWEHSGWEWIKAEDIVSGKIADDCVPKLDQSFRRVFFGPGGVFGHSHAIVPGNPPGKAFLFGLRRLRTDKENGARFLATEAVRSLANVATEMNPFDWKAFKIAAYHLIYSARPSMNAAISSVVVGALTQISGSTTSDAGPAEVVGKLEAFIREREEVSTKISRSFASMMHERYKDTDHIDIVTLSSSSTIRSAIVWLLQNSQLHVNLKVLESRPLCEGASLAAAVLSGAQHSGSASDRLTIQIAPDSHVARMALEMTYPSFLLTGADRISPSGHVSNKTGSCAAAVVAKALSPHTEVIVLSETDKIAKPSDLTMYEKGEENVDREMEEHSPESNDPVEVTKIWPSDVVGAEVQNVYFEWIPRKYIDMYISEDGPLELDRIREISLEKARQEKKMLAGLYDD